MFVHSLFPQGESNRTADKLVTLGGTRADKIGSATRADLPIYLDKFRCVLRASRKNRRG